MGRLLQNTQRHPTQSTMRPTVERTEHAARLRRGADDAKHDRSPRRRQPFTRECYRRRDEGAAAHCLHDARRDEPAEVRGECDGRGAHAEEQHRAEVEPPVAVHVPCPPQQRHRHREPEQVCRHHPREVVETVDADPQVDHHCGERGDDRRLIERSEEHARADDHERGIGREPERDASGLRKRPCGCLGRRLDGDGFVEPGEFQYADDVRRVSFHQPARQAHLPHEVVVTPDPDFHVQRFAFRCARHEPAHRSRGRRAGEHVHGARRPLSRRR